MRGAGYEKFQTLWAPWSPHQLATIDPLCKIDHSILLIDFILGTPDQYQSESLAAHHEWIIKHADEDYTKKWNKDVLRCKQHYAQPDQQLVIILRMDEFLFASGQSEHIHNMSPTIDSHPLPVIPLKRDIRLKCLQDYPQIFQGIEDKGAWKDLWKKVKRHTLINRAKAGRKKQRE